jgi:hypothetical protein
MAPRKVSTANTIPFTPIQTLTPDQADSVNQEGGLFYLGNWVDRGMRIRGGDSHYQCLSNLTAALDLVGTINDAEYNGAAGALSLLPTAGALLGSPAREMWIVYKLVPLAGVLSMFLSLGGSITPSNVGDYDPAEPLSYSGFMPTTGVGTNSKLQHERDSDKPEGSQAGDTFIPPVPIQPVSSQLQDEEVVRASHIRNDAKRFAIDVKNRAMDDRGGGMFLTVLIAMFLQLALIISMLIPMWYAQRGSVVSWWCRVSVKNQPPFMMVYVLTFCS